MFVDVKNRHYNGTDFKPDIMPKSSAAPPNAPYSGLLECPCTDRIRKDIPNGLIDGVPFTKDCLEEPYADLVQQKNPTCWMDTYQGGAFCCQHMTPLLDTNQTQPEGVMTYQLKFRFYFQPYEPATSSNPPSHHNLLRFYYPTDAWAGEYDVPKAAPGTPPEATIHQITARWRVCKLSKFRKKNHNMSGNII